MYLHFAWHLVTSTLTLRGRRGTALGWLWWHTGFPNDAVDAAALCVAGVGLGDMDLHFAWQAWHLVTSCDIDAHFERQAWHLRHWAASGGAPGSQMTPWTPRLFAWQAWHLVTSTVTLRGRRGTWRHGPSLCVAGVALGDMDLHFAWQAWHLATWTFTLCGRRGTW